MKSVEQQARDLLEQCGVEDAQSFTAGDVVALANFINDKTIPDRITRVTVVGNDGQKTHWADHWAISVQDRGQTLKLFAEGDGEAAKAAQARGLSEQLRDRHGLT